MKNIQQHLKNHIVLLDGAMGTELQRAGMPQGVCPEIWCIQNPQELMNIHRQYAQSGADAVYACTFGANAIKLNEHGKHNVTRINSQLVRLARKAVGSRIIVAGDVGPTGKFIEPFGPLRFEDAVCVFKKQIQGLLDGGADWLVIETMIDIQEARAALIAARELTKKFVMVTLTFESSGRTLNGTDPVSALITLQSLGANAVGCNCSLGPEEMIPLIRAMKPYATVPLVAKPNAGLPQYRSGQTFFQMGPKEFAKKAKKLVSLGASLIGGCCGTTPEHISALKRSVACLKPICKRRPSLSAVSSARGHIIFEEEKDVVVVGESINPTRRKVLQQEFSNGKTAVACQLAKEQERAGAKMLDVNVGAVHVDEEKILPHLVGTLSVSSSLPLALDTSNIVAMEKALRVYPGRALINSISAEKTKMKPFLKLAAQYGAMFIALPVGSGSMPKNFTQRKKMIQLLTRQAKHYGMSRSDMMIDGLAMAISSMPHSALDAFKTVQWSQRNLGCHTIIGLSNISFGLPQRQILNSTFFSMLKRHGLSLVIANPAHLKNKEDRYAKDLLLNKDKDARGYVSYAQMKTTENAVSIKPNDIRKLISQAIIDGEREQINDLVQQGEAQGISANAMVHDLMIPAINKVGQLFEQKRYFLPQLVASAETMKNAFEYLEPKLIQAHKTNMKKNIIILATVKGDVHDIGKNIVALMLKNHGFHVIDLGKDVSAKRIINEAKKHKSSIVGLSALMTTTMVNMQDVIRLAKKQRVNCRFMLGGAVVTNDYAKEIGACYSRDGVTAVRIAKQLAKPKTL